MAEYARRDSACAVSAVASKKIIAANKTTPEARARRENDAERYPRPVETA